MRLYGRKLEINLKKQFTEQAKENCRIELCLTAMHTVLLKINDYLPKTFVVNELADLSQKQTLSQQKCMEDGEFRNQYSSTNIPLWQATTDHLNKAHNLEVNNLTGLISRGVGGMKEISVVQYDDIEHSKTGTMTEITVINNIDNQDEMSMNIENVIVNNGNRTIIEKSGNYHEADNENMIMPKKPCKCCMKS